MGKLQIDGVAINKIQLLPTLGGGGGKCANLKYTSAPLTGTAAGVRSTAKQNGVAIVASTQPFCVRVCIAACRPGTRPGVGVHNW